jgi:mannose-6-phosphate isomerase-like protein (cupin superfamily)
MTDDRLPPDDAHRALTLVRPDDDALLHDDRLLVPPGGSPPPHRHDFEETFALVEGEIDVTFRGETVHVRAGETVNIPANAAHSFRNVSDGIAERIARAREQPPRFRTELLGP